MVNLAIIVGLYQAGKAKARLGPLLTPSVIARGKQLHIIKSWEETKRVKAAVRQV